MLYNAVPDAPFWVPLDLLTTEWESSVHLKNLSKYQPSESHSPMKIHYDFMHIFMLKGIIMFIFGSNNHKTIASECRFVLAGEILKR